MKWMLFAAVAAITAVSWLPAEAAQPAPRPEADDAITFEHYRDWRVEFTDRRRSELDMQLSASDLPADRRSRLERSKAYYDWLARLPAAERDAKFRERFDRIDANHDGTIDRAERAAWRDKQRAFYHRDRPARQSAEAKSH
jgi:asparagine synthetase B (glutamine-hydrolysing)